MTFPRFTSMLMFVWLTLGYAIVHLVISLWGMTILSKIMVNNTSFEQLRITSDGEPIIYVVDEFQIASFRRLDGTKIDNTLGIELANPVSIKTSIEHGEPQTWAGRMASYFDYQSPGTAWYLVLPPARNSTAYFVGYEIRSRQRIGYIGMEGFSTRLPAIEQCFPIETADDSTFDGVTAATQIFNEGSQTLFEPWENMVFNSSSLMMENASLDLVWILSKGNVYEISLKGRTVRTVISNRPDLQFLTRTTIKREGKSYLELLLRSEQELVSFDPESGDTRSVTLDPAVKGSYESLYQLPDGKRIFVKSSANRLGQPQLHQIQWINDDGTVERRAEWTSPDTTVSEPVGLGFSLGIPAPLVSLGAWLTTPFLPSSLWKGKDTPLGRMGEFFFYFKVWLGTSLLIGIATGGACRLRERTVFGTSNWFWPILVGACGWFGWMGYICLRPLPARLPRGAWLPSRPEPAQPIDTEIFA